MRRLADSSRPLPGICTLALWCLCIIPTFPFADEGFSAKQLLLSNFSEVETRLPSGTQVLTDAASIELFLHDVDGEPPDWAAVFGHGYHDPGLDERLFELNRGRDARREGNDARRRRIAFVWDGKLSAFDPEAGGFRVAMGPRMIQTRWGMVRFKYDDIPGNLVALPTPSQPKGLLERLSDGQSREIEVVMVGTLVPEESIVYGFSHDQEGVGLIMPVIHIEGIFYLRDPSRSRR